MTRRQPVPVEAENEPLWLLRSIPYSDYRMTIWWRRRRDAYEETVIRRLGMKDCEVCRIRGDTLRDDLRFHVHHITYDRLGDEQDDDLILLCSMCHNAIHYPDSAAARHWVAYNEKYGYPLLFEFGKKRLLEVAA